MMNAQTPRATILRDSSATFETLESDVLTFATGTAHAREAHETGHLGLADLCFWYKSLIRAFLAQVEAQCSVLRTLTAAHAALLRTPVPAKRLDEIAAVNRRLPTERSMILAFRYFPMLFGVNASFTSDDENYRGFKALTDARERFTHPKAERDVCPFELFPSAMPAMEWFFLHWRSVLLNCAATVYHIPPESGLPQVPNPFKDNMLAPFQDLQKQASTSQKDNPVFHAVRTVVHPLLADTCRAKRLVGDSTSVAPVVGAKAALRCLIRTMFSEIEGTTYVAESLVRQRRGDNPDVGRSFLAGSHEKMREVVATTIEAFSYEFGFGRTIRKGGKSWEAFLVAREVRDRLTHPKRPGDLEVGPDDLTAMLQVESWWHHDDVAGCMKLNAARL